MDLQGGDTETRRLWRILVDESNGYFERVYRKLDVDALARRRGRRSPAYNPMLDQVVVDLDAAGLLVESDGAQCVFPEGYTNRDGEPLPLIVRKSDGGYGYAATDLAAIRDRVGTLGCDRLYYVVGAPQAQHLEMVFAVARMAGWVPERRRRRRTSPSATSSARTTRCCGAAPGRPSSCWTCSTRPSRARTGRSTTRDSDYGADERALLAETIGIGAVKYADLSTERLARLRLRLGPDAVLRREHRSLPRLRAREDQSIFRRIGVDGPAPGAVVVLVEPEERALGLELLRFPEALDATLEWLAPHRLCAYLFALAQSFTAFYEHCPVLRAPDETTRQSRLVLCEQTAATLELGLSLLGIHAPERM